MAGIWGGGFGWYGRMCQYKISQVVFVVMFMTANWSAENYDSLVRYHVVLGDIYVHAVVPIWGVPYSHRPLCLLLAPLICAMGF